MIDPVIWTSNRARDEFDLLLDEAKTKGPQEIRDARGRFTLHFNPEPAKGCVAEFLSKGLPDAAPK